LFPGPGPCRAGGTRSPDDRVKTIAVPRRCGARARRAVPDAGTERANGPGFRACRSTMDFPPLDRHPRPS
jgi:hypothetical protein